MFAKGIYKTGLQKCRVWKIVSICCRSAVLNTFSMPRPSIIYFETRLLQARIHSNKLHTPVGHCTSLNIIRESLLPCHRPKVIAHQCLAHVSYCTLSIVWNGILLVYTLSSDKSIPMRRLLVNDRNGNAISDWVGRIATENITVL